MFRPLAEVPGLAPVLKGGGSARVSENMRSRHVYRGEGCGGI